MITDVFDVQCDSDKYFKSMAIRTVNTIKTKISESWDKS